MFMLTIIRAPPRRIEYPRAVSRPLVGQCKPATEPRGDGPRMGRLDREND